MIDDALDVRVEVLGGLFLVQENDPHLTDLHKVFEDFRTWAVKIQNPVTLLDDKLKRSFCGDAESFVNLIKLS